MQTPEVGIEIVGGVDTHKHTHTVAAVDANGGLLGTAEYPATVDGYRMVLSWFRELGKLSRVGIEATGSYGAGLTRHLVGEGVEVVEVLRPNRQLRRRRGKSDPTDAEAAARAALSGEAAGTPKSADGTVEAMRMVRLVRSSAIKTRTQAANQLHALVGTAPEGLRERLRDLRVAPLVREVRRWRPGKIHDPYSGCRATLNLLAKRWKNLNDEIHRYDDELKRLTRQACPGLLELVGVGPEVASCLMVAAGDNPGRLRSEASFAALCGVSPLDASSGRQRRHRLNRGGNRQANRALWVIAFIRLRVDSRTKAYAARRTKQGRTRPEITRYEEFTQLLMQTYGSPRVMNPGLVLKKSLIALALFGEGSRSVVPNPDFSELFDGYSEVLRTLLPKELGFEKLEIRMPDVVLVTRTGDFALDAMSGGVSSLFGIAWQIYMFGAEKGDCTVLFDEPENHLHPSMQRTLLPSLAEAFPEHRFVIATHSPFVITSHPEATVVGLSFDESGRIRSQVLDEQDLTGSPNAVLRDILDVPTTIPLWVEKKITEILQIYEDEADASEKASKIFAELKRQRLNAALEYFYPSDPTE